ncbi:hypothetical protein O3G_MSEX006250 [Manduca sexta]|uniref:Uncharacterized protein n=1 Tax=Manduca sexta TaxID=7130 RepID=A0A921Z2T8_MANSE|nr:hypothetical protein O3G_MSEX006250 [Manduca sexta]
MIRGILILTLLAVAHALFPYKDSADNIKEGLKQLEDQILSMAGNIPNITDSRRHYAVLVTHIALVAASIAENCGSSYEHVYIESLPENIAIALSDVDYIISVTSSAIEFFNNHTREIQDLFETLCPKATPNVVCSQLIYQTINGDSPRYQRQIAIVIIAGAVAEKLFDADFITVAKHHDEIEYLVGGVNSFSNFIGFLVELLRFINGKPHCR